MPASPPLKAELDDWQTVKERRVGPPRTRTRTRAAYKPPLCAPNGAESRDENTHGIQHGQPEFLTHTLCMPYAYTIPYACLMHAFKLLNHRTDLITA
jgi:hypothetical protein